MALVVHHAHTRPTPPSERSEMPIPPALDRVVMDCLSKNPKDRPQSAKELSRRLAEIAGSEPWTDERAREWWEAHDLARSNGEITACDLRPAPHGVPALR